MNVKEKVRYVHDEVAHNMKASGIVVPIVLELFPQTKSVVDFGCGIGTWLKAFKNNGIEDVLGLDGKWYNKDLLFKYITETEFKCVDLEKPIHLDKTYDLVISLEVAEHLVASSADDFVCSLVAAGKVVLFGAAIPIQDGQNHINEQWSYYWIEKFKSHGYNCYDIIRSKIWGYDEVDFPYKSNTFIFVHNSIEMQGCSSDDTPPIYLHPYMCNKIDKIILGKRGVSFYIKLLVKSIINKFSGGGYFADKQRIRNYGFAG